ncbi:DUF2332 family protein [Blastococcus sp. SYSU D00669]
MSHDERDRIVRGFRHFAEVDAPVSSPRYAELAAAVARDPAVLDFLAGLPDGKGRQPPLLFAALRFLFGDVRDPAELHRLVVGHADRLRRTVLSRSTQTNEPARCAALLPVLAALPGPLSLVEVGSSAGLCLYPDRYSYEYDGRPVGLRSPVHLRCTTSGEGPVPERVPEVVARIGIDLDPLDPADPDDLAWLRTLVWPGPPAAERLARLDAAAAIAAAEPAQVLRGDLVDRLPDALELVAPGSTVVVFHTAVLLYPPRERRAAFVDLVRSLPVRWLAQEARGVLPELEVGPDDGRFVLALDGRPLARTAPHGGRLDWLPGAQEIMAG